jgi:site-specific recombinase XerD
MLDEVKFSPRFSGRQIRKQRGDMARIKLFRRHLKSCDHKTDKYYQRCSCPVWFETNLFGRRWDVETQSWALTEKQESFQSRWTSRATNWKEAEHLAHQLDEKLTDLLQGRTRPDAKTVEEAITLFLQNKEDEQLAPDTLYRHKYTTSLLLEFCKRQGIQFVKDITVSHLGSWRSEWTVKTPQARRAFQEKVRNFFKFCFMAGWLSSNPAASLSAIKVKNVAAAVRPFTPQEYEAIIAAVDKTTLTAVNKARVKACMQLQRFSGLSLVDAVTLRQDELIQDKVGFRVKCDRQKTETHIDNAIPSWLGRELLTVKNGNPEHFFWSGLTTTEDAPSYFHKMYRRVFKAAGVEGSSHDLRHTYAVDLLEKGLRMEDVKKALGHSSIQITERYYGKWSRGQQDNLDAALRGVFSEAQ